MNITAFFSNLVFGRRVLSGLWPRLHRVALLGMNVGLDCSVDVSGEKWVIQFVSNRVKKQKRPVIFDVGANVGVYSNAVLRTLGENVALFSFEPSPTAYRKLKESQAGHENARAFNLGLSSESGTKQLFQSQAGSSRSSFHQPALEMAKVSSEPLESVELTTLDAFCGKENIQMIDLLKLDVEGHEIEALKGARKMIESGAIDCVQFEFGGCNLNSRTSFLDFFQLLSPRYDLFRVLKNGLYPIPEYSEILEIYRTANYLAVAKERKSQSAHA